MNNIQLKIKNRDIGINERLVISQFLKQKLNKIIKNKDNMVCINDYGDINLLNFFKDKQKIGSIGKYGDVYKLSVPISNINIDISIKIVPLSYQSKVNIYNTKYPIWREIKALELVSNLIKKRICPNVPLLYDFYICNYCNYENPEIDNQKNKTCVLILNELSDTDLRRWILLKSKQTLNVNYIVNMWYNLFFQIFSGLYSIFKYYQLIHNDLHWGNILVSNHKKGGYWIYEINKIKFYIPNLGFIMKLWDFGKSNSPIYFKNTKTDIHVYDTNNTHTYRYDWINSDVEKITHIVEWIQNTYLITNKDIIPHSIIQFIHKIRQNKEFDILKIFLKNFRRYLNNQIGKSTTQIGIQIDDISDISVGDIVIYQKKHALVIDIFNFNYILITNLLTYDDIQVNFKYVQKHTKQIESILTDKIIGYFRM